MIKHPIPNQTNSWKNLNIHFKEIHNLHLFDLFKNDNNRFKNFSFNFKNKLLVDISKNRITNTTIKILLNLAKEMNLSQAIESMFCGEKINLTEQRPVLHTALRNFSNNPIFFNESDIMLEINKVLNKMKYFSEKIINGTWKGYSGKSIQNVVNIGIGGSDLGPKMVTEALRFYKNHLNIFFISNIDGTEIFNILKLIDFETTIFLISSKTFTTQETIVNFKTIKDIFFKKVNNKNILDKHFFAITVNENEAMRYGITKENIFKLWDWVGGRYSLWSAMGLSIILSLGFDNFIQLLSGAYDMDIHFRTTSFEKNIPVLLGLIGIWYNNFFNSETEAILPYDQYLYNFPMYIQQSNMESNGKNIDKNGNKVSWQTGPIIWGTVGTNGQHSFYQLIHQGTKLIPCDFIASIFSHNPINDHHVILLSNFFAQTHALAFGQNFYKNNNLKKNTLHDEYVEKFKFFEGNRPSNSFLFQKMDPYSLGVLISLYEHKIFTQGVIFNIFSFDQWGVELGKNISNNIFKNLVNKKKEFNYDSSTEGLINFYNNIKK